ncbi:hypothetical protein [Schlesneria sp. DSM 10557]|uniref:hypothetical protein n=1 Tax=Schlesneria sp. DSM 10557 TaxID=3044399 RepID=UPI0035A1931C
MFHTRYLWSVSLVLLIGLVNVSLVFGAEDLSGSLNAQLQQGQFAAAQADLEMRLKAEPEEAQARFGLGVIQVLSAIEKLGQEQYRFGAMSGNIRNLPVLRLRVPVNPDPEEVRYEQVRQIIVDFQRRLIEAEAELAKVDLKQNFKLKLDLNTIRLDLIGSGKKEDQATFLQLFNAVNQRGPVAALPDLSVAFDNGDVLWLRGYCHFIAAFCDMTLAYDHQRLFDHVGQLIYPRHISSDPIAEPLDLVKNKDQTWQFMDLITAVHLLNLPLKEPARMESARQHLLEMIRMSRESWALIQAETDDDREWLPNPKQKGVLRVPVTREIIDGWHAVLIEMEELLEGRKLVPFWRDYASVFGGNREIPDGTRGINLKRVFAEPRDFDLILLIQGSGVRPYLERGPLSTPETWENLGRVFRGQFFGFAAWFN